MSLTVLIIALVETADDDHVVSLACLGDSIGDELLARAGVCQILPGRHTIIGAGGITDIPTLILHGGHILESGLQAVERRDLPLSLQRRRTATDGHHLDGILAHDEHLRMSGQLERKHSATVL